MSATGRNKPGSERIPFDDYPTPPWTVRRFLEAVHLPFGRWLDAGAGCGNIIRTVIDYRREMSRSPLDWWACEIQPRYRKGLVDIIGNEDHVVIGDFLDDNAVFDRLLAANLEGIIMNPPYGLASVGRKRKFGFVERALHLAPTVIALLRTNFVGADCRQDFFTMGKGGYPDMFVLPNRPRFVRGQSDNSEYAWFRWQRNEPRTRSEGRWCRLGLTPKKVRSAEEADE